MLDFDMANLSLGQLIGAAILVVYTFFGVVPLMLNAISQFTVMKRFSAEMVDRGIIKKETVDALLPKKQVAGVIISALTLFVLLSVCIKSGGDAWFIAGIPFGVALLKYRKILEFNTLTIKRFMRNFQGEYDEKKLKKYVDERF